MQMILLRLVNEVIYQREIKPAFFRLDQLPRNRRQHRVKMHCHQLRPDGFHIIETGRTRIVQFAAEDEKWFAIHHQLRCRAALFKMGNR